MIMHIETMTQFVINDMPYCLVVRRLDEIKIRWQEINDAGHHCRRPVKIFVRAHFAAAKI